MHSLIKESDAVYSEYGVDGFKVFSAQRNITSNKQILHIVIEGDGYAWVNRYTPSDNPTPKNPVGAKIFNSMPSSDIYLARICQYTITEKCQSPRYWTSHRFSPEIISVYSKILDRIKETHNNASFIITGFSGGARIAYDLSKIRTDVTRVNSVAGVIDVNAWVKHHKLSPLTVLNHDNLNVHSNTEYVYICGGKDIIAPCSIHSQIFIEHKNLGQKYRTINIKNYRHNNLWRPALEHL